MNTPDNPGRTDLVLFAKAPLPGVAKTRLAAALGGETAARLQEAFIRDVGANLARVGDVRVLAQADEREHPVFEALRALGWASLMQGPGDLGERIARVLEARFSDGAARVVFVGSDAPTLPPWLVEQAIAALDTAEVVVVPAFDGGYVAIGFRSRAPEALEGVPWGTPDVLHHTIGALEASGRRYQVLPFWYDVDDVEALDLLGRHLAVPGPFFRELAPHTAKCLGALR